MYERRLGRPDWDVILINALILVFKGKSRAPFPFSNLDIDCDMVWMIE
jgi:hypothetical protein